MNNSFECLARIQKKTDESEPTDWLAHVGLLVNWLPGTAGAPFI
jgi:hypothetical protein